MIVKAEMVLKGRKKPNPNDPYHTNAENPQDALFSIARLT